MEKCCQKLMENMFEIITKLSTFCLYKALFFQMHSQAFYQSSTVYKKKSIFLMILQSQNIRATKAERPLAPD